MPETEITPVDRRTRIARHLTAYDTAIRDYLGKNPSDESYIRALFAQLDPQIKAIEGNSRRQITS